MNLLMKHCSIFPMMTQKDSSLNVIYLSMIMKHIIYHLTTWAHGSVFPSKRKEQEATESAVIIRTISELVAFRESHVNYISRLQLQSQTTGDIGWTFGISLPQKHDLLSILIHPDLHIVFWEVHDCESKVVDSPDWSCEVAGHVVVGLSNIGDDSSEDQVQLSGPRLYSS